MRIDAIFLRELRLPLVKPFQTSFGTTTDRRILLVELRGEGLSGWGECVAGEHPFFSDETVDTAWLVIQQELAPVLAAADPEHGGKCPGLFRQVRGHRMAKAALENAKRATIRSFIRYLYLKLSLLIRAAPELRFRKSDA